MQLAVAVAQAQQRLVLRHVAAATATTGWYSITRLSCSIASRTCSSSAASFIASATRGGSKRRTPRSVVRASRAIFSAALIIAPASSKPCLKAAMPIDTRRRSGWPERGEGRLHHGLAQLHRQRFQRRSSCWLSIAR
jgi:hypothetical protein